MPENPPEQHRIRNKFSPLVDAYAKYRRDYPEKAYDLIYAFCPDVHAQVLDVGCGTGIVTRHLAGHYAHITGTDKEEGMLAEARSKSAEGGEKQSQITFLNTTVESMPFEAETFDLVIAASAYHWFDYITAGKEIYRVLKTKGKLCVCWKHQREKTFANLPIFAYENLKKFVADVPRSNKGPIGEQIFKDAGFNTVRLVEFNFDENYSVEEVLGYIQSHSTYNLLNDIQKESYMTANRESVHNHLIDGVYIFKYKMVMYFVEK
jgi:SAM-dependent methyltransferase